MKRLVHLRRRVRQLSSSHQDNLRRCIELARQAGVSGEVPGGALVARSDGTVLGRASNRSVRDKNATGHAEMLAMAAACDATGAARLDGHILYVSLEPCVMCFGAALLHRLSSVVYATPSPKFGAVSCGIVSLLHGRYNHSLDIVHSGGVSGEESAVLLRAFFSERRRAARDAMCSCPAEPEH